MCSRNHKQGTKEYGELNKAFHLQTIVIIKYKHFRDTHVNLKNHPNTSQTIVFFDYTSKKMVKKEERGKNIYKSDVPTFWYDKKVRKKKGKMFGKV